MDDTPGRVLDEYLASLSQAGAVDALDGLARRWTRLLRDAARMLGGSADAAGDLQLHRPPPLGQCSEAESRRRGIS